MVNIIMTVSSIIFSAALTHHLERLEPALWREVEELLYFFGAVLHPQTSRKDRAGEWESAEACMQTAKPSWPTGDRVMV